MPEPRHNDLSLSLDAKERIDRVCWTFEEAWRNGGSPKAEEFLGEAAGEERSALVIELLLLDLDYRQRQGETPKADDYQARFRGDETLIEQAFQRARAAEAAASQAASHDELLGTHIGPYKLLDVLGEGGFGIVYLAEQEAPIRRQVAMKILKPGMDTRQVLARFEAERQTLALMDHSHIARVFDAGMTEGGRSYFVMELVRGEPITAYCDNHKLALKERLALFLTVCQAVQHAHQKGIIHRDIKPTNILVAVVDGRPAPKIIDFGLAKAMARPLTQESIFTEHGQLLGTPDYMSPEQAGGSPLAVDSRSDIYSLGVLLYVLLTGALPFDRRILRQAGFDEICRIIREEEPPLPSSRVSAISEDSKDRAKNRRADPQSLCRQLREDLDWIAMKAVEKAPERRYATAIALAEDIEHYLAHEPVQAGPPDNWYRARKFARRFRVPLAVAGGVAALLVAITVLAVRGYYREAKLTSDAETARRQAEHSAEKAKKNFKLARDAVKKYYTQVANDPRLKPHDLETLRRDLLKSANEYYERMSGEEQDDPELLEDRAWSFIDRGDIEREVGNWSAAEAAYKAAADGAARLIQQFGLQPKYQDCRAAAQNNLGGLYFRASRLAEAEAAYKLAIADGRALVEKRPGHAECQKGLADSYHNLGNLYFSTGRLKEAEAAHKEALAIRRTLDEKHPGTPEFQDLSAASCDALGNVILSAGRTSEAESLKKEAIAIQKLLVEKHPDVPEYQNDLAGSYKNLGHLYSDIGRSKEAEASYKEAAARWRALMAKHPNVPEYQSELADTYYSLGILNRAAGRAAEAEADYKDALAIFRVLAAKYPEAPDYQGRLADSGYNLGNLYLAAGRSKEAEAAYEEAIGLLKPLVAKHPDVADNQHLLAKCLCNLGIVHKAAGRTKEAESAFEEARDRCEAMTKKDPEAFESQSEVGIKSNINLVELYKAAGRTNEALAAAERVAAIRTTLAEKHPEQHENREILAMSCFHLACMEAESLAGTNDVPRSAGPTGAASGATVEKVFAYLQQACDLGLFDNPALLNQLKSEADLNSLRGRPEYQRLLERNAARSKTHSTSAKKP